MSIKLYNSELKVMEVFWREGDMRAARVCDILEEEIGWNPNTTYTIIKKCVSKGYVERKNPGFWCHPLITKDEVRTCETKNLIDKMFDGSSTKFFAAFIDNRELLTEEEFLELKELIENKCGGAKN